MRPVQIYKFDEESKSLQVAGQGVFHGFGLDVLETETSCASYSTALVELSTGQMENVPAEHIQFLDKQDA